MTTYKQTAREAKQATLLVYPDTDDQRALGKAMSDRPDQMANRITKARQEHPGAPLAWLMPGGALVPVIP
jgi:hypothetical protein